MANVTAAMVKELRDKTGAGMMDCKAALTESQGDMEAAVDWLRKKGLSKAAKKVGRVAAEGLVGVASDGRAAAVVEVNSETDFVARNAQFQALVKTAAELALAGDGSVAGIEGTVVGGTSFKEKLNEAVATIGEHMTLRRAERLSVSDGVVASYVHGSTGEGIGRIGVLVALEAGSGGPELAALGRGIAMHVAAMNPLAVDASGIDAGTLEREKAILLEKHRGKPENVQQKIVESGLKSYYKEVCLLDQAYVHDGTKTVGQVLKESEGKFGGALKLVRFVRYGLGDGIEKSEGDFAAEVAAAAAGGR